MWFQNAPDGTRHASRLAGELLLIQALMQRAETLKLPYRELLELAAARSSSKTADFLRNA
jgi:hypothetical protein